MKKNTFTIVMLFGLLFFSFGQIATKTNSVCIPTYDSAAGFGTMMSEVSIEGTSLLNTSGNTYTVPVYTYYTGSPNLTASLTAGNEYIMDITNGQYGFNYFACWIDTNDNDVFELSERVGYTPTLNGNSIVNLPIIINCTSPVGIHRMRVRKANFTGTGADMDPCANYPIGEVEDYDVTITPADSCPNPTSLNAINLTPTSADLTWLAGCSETSWDLHLTTQGGGPPTGVPSNPGLTTTTFSATSLSPNAHYEFYVRALCGGGSGSNWSGPYSFTCPDLLPGCSVATDPVDGATGVVLDPTNMSCGLYWTAPTTGGAILIYKIYFGTSPTSLTLVGYNIHLMGGLSYNTTYYWQAIGVNDTGEAINCTVNSFTTQAPVGYCLNFNNPYPDTIFTPSVCDGVTDEPIATDCWSREYTRVAVTNGTIYKFSSSRTTDLITISEDSGATAVAYGTTPLTWTSDIDGEIWFYTHVDVNCSQDQTDRTRSVTCNLALKNESFSLDSFHFFPNPVKNVMNLTYDKIITKATVFNSVGQQLLSKDINALQGSLDLSSLSNGVYFVKIISDDKIHTVKIIRE